MLAALLDLEPDVAATLTPTLPLPLTRIPPTPNPDPVPNPTPNPSQVADTLLRLIAVCSTQNPHLALAAADAAGGGGGGGGGKKAAAVKQAQGATAAFAASFAERCSP